MSDVLSEQEYQELLASGDYEEVDQGSDTQTISQADYDQMLQSGDYEEVPDPGYLESISAGVKDGALGLSSQTAGLFDTISDLSLGANDLLGNTPFGAFLSAMNYGSEAGDASGAREALEAERAENRIDNTTFKVASGATDAFGKMLAGPFAAPLFGLGAGSEKYQQLRDEGIDRGTAALAGTTYGGAISQTEKIGLEKALARTAPGIGNRFADYLRAGAAEAGEEALEVPIEKTIDSLARGNSLGDTVDDLLSYDTLAEMGEAAKIGGITGGVVRAGVDTTRAVTDRIHNDQLAIDDLIEGAEDLEPEGPPTPSSKDVARAKRNVDAIQKAAESFPANPLVSTQVLSSPGTIAQGRQVLNELQGEQSLIPPEAQGGEPITQEDLSAGVPSELSPRDPETQAEAERVRRQTELFVNDAKQYPVNEGDIGVRGKFTFDPESGEFGGTPILDDAVQGIRSAYRRVTDSIKDGAIRKAAIESGQLKIDPRKPRETLTEKNDTLGKALRVSAFEETIAKRIPEYRDVVKTNYELEEQKHTNKAELAREADAYFKLTDKRKVHQLLVAQRIAQSQGKHINETDEALLQKGFSQQEIEALRSVRRAMGKAADKIREGLLANTPGEYRGKEAEYKAAVDALIDQHFKTALYVPFTRRGKHYVYAADYKDGESGNTGYFSLHESKAEAKREEIKLLKQGLKNVERGEMRPNNLREGRTIDPDKQRGASLEAFADLDPEVVARLSDLDPEASEALSDMTEGLLSGGRGDVATGFNKHLMKAKLTAGYSQDMERGIAEYLTSLSNWHAVKLSNPKYNMAIAKLEDAGKKELVERAKWRKNYMQTRKPEMQKYRRFLGLYYLTRPLSAVVNGTQSVTTTQPAIAEYDGYVKAWGTYSKAMKDTGKYLLNKNAFARDKQLNSMLKKFSDSGVLDDQNTKELSGRASGRIRGKGGPTMEDVLMLGFSTAETLNRHHAFFAGYDIGKRRGLKDTELEEFTKDFIRKTQFDYTKANRPEMATGRFGAPAMTFRLFQGNYARFLIDRMSNAKKGGDLKAKRALAASLMHMGALGGVAAFPAAREILKAFEAAGEDPKQYIRHLPMDEDWQDLLIYGLPGMFGYNISGSIAFGELAPDIEQGLPAALFRMVGGVPIDIPQRVGKAAWQGYDQDNWDMALETMMPPAMRALMQTARWNYEASKDREPYMRGYRTSTNQYLAGDKEPSIGELVWKAAGGTPTRLSKEFERLHSEQLKAEDYRNNEGYNTKIANAIMEGDGDRIRGLVAEAAEGIRKVMADDSLSAIDREAAIRKNLPSEQVISQLVKSKILQTRMGTPKIVREQIRGVRESFGTGPELPAR